jgi:hypothetical protein
MKFNSHMRYGVLVVLVFLVEVAIASGRIPGHFVRGSLGDVLAVVLVYLVLRTLTDWSSRMAAALAVACGFAVEGSQYVHTAQWLGFAPGSIGMIVLGNTFSLSDLLMYLCGGVLSFVLDRYLVAYFKNR